MTILKYITLIADVVLIVFMLYWTFLIGLDIYGNTIQDVILSGVFELAVLLNTYFVWESIRMAKAKK